jgi:hypothetical protein
MLGHVGSRIQGDPIIPKDFSMFKFRPHRGSLEEAMQEVVELETAQDLIDHLESQYEHLDASAPTINVEPYGYDNRIDWDTHIVSIAGFGVVGFTDRVPPETKPVASSSPRP